MLSTGPRSGAVSLLHLLLALGLALLAAFGGGVYFALEYRRQAKQAVPPSRRSAGSRLGRQTPPVQPPPAEQPGAHRLRISFTWNGDALPEDAPPATATMSRADAGGVYRLRVLSRQLRPDLTGITAEGLHAGRYLLQVYLHKGARGPGSYWYGTEIADPIIVPGPSEITIPLIKIMRILSPADDTGRRRDNRRNWDAVPVLPRPLAFAWEPVADGASYEVAIGKVDVMRHAYIEGAALRRITAETSLQVDLPPAERPWVYAFHVYASKDGRRIGRPWFRSESNWNYEFR